MNTSEDAPAPEPEREDLLGLSIAPLTDELRSSYKIGRAIEGVVITEVEANSPAAQKNVKPGDVIVEVTQEKVSEPQDVKARVARGEKIRAALGAAAAVRHQGRAPLRRRADDLGPAHRPRAHSHPDCRADRERQIGRRARAGGGTARHGHQRRLDAGLSRAGRADGAAARRPTWRACRTACTAPVSAAEACSVGSWLDDAARAIAEARTRERVPILVGGTGLYFKALTEGLAAIPDIPADIREHWRERAEAQGVEHLHRELAARDPAMAARLKPTDPQRIARALEVIDATGVSLAEWQGASATPALPPHGVLKLVIAPEREPLYATIDARFESMIGQGALEEVRRCWRWGSIPGSRPCARMACASLALISAGASTWKRRSPRPRPRPAAMPSGK